MGYFKSRDVHVFPSYNRLANWEFNEWESQLSEWNLDNSSESKYNSDSKFNSEYNYINMLKSITDYNSFVIRCDNEIIELVINGYYFKVKHGENETWPSLNNNLYFIIKVKDNSKSLINYSEEEGELDQSNEFKGLFYTYEQPSYAEENEYILQACDRGEVINKIKFKGENISYNSTLTIKDKLDTKQNILTASNGLNISNDTLEIDKTINNNRAELVSRVANKGNSSKFVYLNNAYAIETNVSKGSEHYVVTVDDKKYHFTRSTYTVDGEIKDGRGFFYSEYSYTYFVDFFNTLSWDDIRRPKPGDFWLVY